MQSVKNALEGVYNSLKNDNEEIDVHIDLLKIALEAEGNKEVIVDPMRLAQNNRQGRKTMQAYFKKRGVEVIFSKEVNK